VWVGLQPPLQPVFAGRRPANLVPSGCAHLDIREDRVALPADIPYAAARLVVDDVDGRGRRETFEFAYPGTLAMLRWIDRDGVCREQILDKNAIVVIRPGDARLLEVSAQDPGSTLIVSAEVRPRAFADRARVGIPLATVAEACRGGADRLVVRGADGSEIALARFTVPYDVDPWVESSEPARDERSLLLGFREPLDQLRLCARDLWHGRTTTIELAPDGLCRRAPNGITLRLQPDHSGPGSLARLVAEFQDWPDGLWLCELDARLGDDLRWQPLCNARGDSFAWLVAHGIGQLLASELTATLSFAERIQIFARCHKVLQRCFAQLCWDGGVHSILQLWRRLACSIAADPRLTEFWPALLPLAFIEPPLEASESWLPLASFWDALPKFMSLPGACYAHVREINRDDTAVLASLADLADAGSVSRFLQRWRLDASFFSCFANLGEVDRTEGRIECRDFHLGHYTQRVRRAIDDGGVLGWSPDDGMLSPAHWLSAFESLRRRYHMLTRGHGNAQRIPGAARLVHDASRWLDRDGRGLAEAAIPDFVLNGAALTLPIPVDEDEDALLQDAPAALCAIALACRVEFRRPGALDAFINVLAGLDRDRTQVSADLNFLTAAGRDLFAFWLLFWDVLLTTGERCRT
jgi:hypothetical protein